MGNAELLTKKELAESLNCSESTVDRLRKSGLISEIRIPNLGLRFERTAAVNLIETYTYRNESFREFTSPVKPVVDFDLKEYDRLNLKNSQKGESSVHKKCLSWNYGKKGVFLRKTKKGETWYVWYYKLQKDGSEKRTKERIPYATNREEAVVAMLMIVKKEFDKRYRDGKGKKSATFREFAGEYLKKYAKVHKRSWKSDEFYLNSHLIPFFGDCELSEIDSENVSEFIAQKVEAGIKQNSINRYIQVLRKIMNLAIDWGYGVEKNPVQRDHLFKEDEFSRDVVWTEEEYQRLLAVASPHLRSILVCVWNTGMRKSEILTLEWKDVSLSGEIPHLVVRAENSKSGKMRSIPLNGALLVELRKLKARTNGSCDHVFTYYDHSLKKHRPIKEFKNAFLNACKKVGIKGKRFHDFRHSFASRALENGANLVAVKNILGHSKLGTTEIYLHADQESKKQAVDHVGESHEKRDSSSEELSRICPAKEGSSEKFPLTHLISSN